MHAKCSFPVSVRGLACSPGVHLLNAAKDGRGLGREAGRNHRPSHAPIHPSPRPPTERPENRLSVAQKRPLVLKKLPLVP